MEKESQTMMWVIGLIAIAVIIIATAKIAFPEMLTTVFAWFKNSLNGIKM